MTKSLIVDHGIDEVLKAVGFEKELVNGEPIIKFMQSTMEIETLEDVIYCSIEELAEYGMNKNLAKIFVGKVQKKYGVVFHVNKPSSEHLPS